MDLHSPAMYQLRLEIEYSNSKIEAQYHSTTANGAKLNLGYSFTQEGASANSIGGDITSAVSIQFDTGIDLTNNVTMKSGLGIGDDINLESTIHGTHDLTITGSAGRARMRSVGHSDTLDESKEKRRQKPSRKAVLKRQPLRASQSQPGFRSPHAGLDLYEFSSISVSSYDSVSNVFFVVGTINLFFY